MRHYDYIIAGAGGAGLSLAYHLSQSPLRTKSVLLVDKAPKTENDRTWCFWERGNGPFQPVVYREWAKVDFHGTHFSQTLDLGGYCYKMIRSADFYRFVRGALAGHPAFEWRYGTISSIRDTASGAEITLDGTTYTADWVFHSLYDYRTQLPVRGYHYFLQHFKGWIIETAKPQFDPNKATFMDFRIAQCDREARFFYVLPFDERRALVEFTVFSEQLLSDAAYESAVSEYVAAFLQITEYAVVHREFGVIPMFDAPFPARDGRHVIRIGTAGGQTKASTGYTFRRIQQHSQAIVRQLIAGKQPLTPNGWTNRFKLYDRILLNVMANNRHSMKDVFTQLFKKNPPGQILKFLDEETSLMEDLRITATVPYIPFMRALADVAFAARPKNPLPRAGM